MDIRKIRIADYDYPLPDGRIALHPLGQRDACRLLSVNKAGKISHHRFSDLPMLLSSDSLIVANETKVIRARLTFEKETGARIEIFLLEPYKPHDYAVSFASTSGCSWICLVGNKKRWKGGFLTLPVQMDDEGKTIELRAEIGEYVSDSGVEVRFSWDAPEYSFAEILEKAGNMPIPPYLKRESEETDTTDYQTVYSRVEGSVAAPTAGLHFTPELIEKLKKKGDRFATVTLHVGAGTFQPVKSEEIGDHPMHTEWISVSRTTLQAIIEALENGRDIVAVGTTSVRTVESLPYIGAMIEEDSSVPTVSQWMAYQPEYSCLDTIYCLRRIIRYMDKHRLEALQTTTAIMIAPGFRWRIVNRLITNFHQPKSTLLLLVSSFLGADADGKEKWRKAYCEAMAGDYRFLSYGDACLFERGVQPVELPSAKSMVVRAATILAAKEPSRLAELVRRGGCDDIVYYIEALREVLDSVRLPEGEIKDIYIGEGAAPLRFLTAFASSLPGSKVRITCAPGLQKRPISPLVSTLKELGADLHCNETPGNWEIIIHGRKLEGGEVSVESSFTSQYVSALLLASQLWSHGMEMSREMRDKLVVSQPYVSMTEAMIKEGITEPEPDWSGAAFFYEYTLMTGKPVAFERLTPPEESLQGDSICADVYKTLGVETEYKADGSAQIRKMGEPSYGQERRLELNLKNAPDFVPSLAVALCYRQIPFRLTGIGHLRYKECDRLSVLQRLLLSLGYEIEVEADAMEFNGEFRPMREFPVEIDPYGDHRMAMAFYPLELLGMVRVEDKDVVRKSFPNFYQQFK